jgi:hypothetical protein
MQPCQAFFLVIFPGVNILFAERGNPLNPFQSVSQEPRARDKWTKDLSPSFPLSTSVERGTKGGEVSQGAQTLSIHLF